LFVKSLGLRVAMTVTKEFNEPQGHGDTWSKTTANN